MPHILHTKKRLQTRVVFLHKLQLSQLFTGSKIYTRQSTNPDRNPFNCVGLLFFVFGIADSPQRWRVAALLWSSSWLRPLHRPGQTSAWRISSSIFFVFSGSSSVSIVKRLHTVNTTRLYSLLFCIEKIAVKKHTVQPQSALLTLPIRMFLPQGSPTLNLTMTSPPSQ